MKKQEVSIAQMDEIIFEHRNKAYGAYLLRKMYNKHLSRAMFLAVAILFAGLAYPLVSSYTALHRIGSIGGDVIVDVFTMPNPKDEIIVPPLPPPPTAELQKQIRFVTPEVVTGDVVEETDPLNMDDFNKISTNEIVNTTEEKPVEKQVVIIEDPETAPPVISVEEMPSFPGGETERLQYLVENIEYPQLAAETGIQGTVYVQFIVNSKGNITDAKILRGIGGGCDEEALRVVKAMPQWHPGKQNGQPVRVLYNMSINFRLRS